MKAAALWRDARRRAKTSDLFLASSGGSVLR
jgi:hypothetical protein